MAPCALRLELRNRSRKRVGTVVLALHTGVRSDIEIAQRELYLLEKKMKPYFKAGPPNDKEWHTLSGLMRLEADLFSRLKQLRGAI